MFKLNFWVETLSKSKKSEQSSGQIYHWFYCLAGCINFAAQDVWTFFSALAGSWSRRRYNQWQKTASWPESTSKATTMLYFAPASDQVDKKKYWFQFNFNTAGKKIEALLSSSWQRATLIRNLWCFWVMWFLLKIIWASIHKKIRCNAVKCTPSVRAAKTYLLKPWSRRCLLAANALSTWQHKLVSLCWKNCGE